MPVSSEIVQSVLVDATEVPFGTAGNPLSSLVAGSELATYVSEAALAGANNKDMLSIFNPGGSGKVLRVWRMWAVVPSSSGTTVIIPFEIRWASAIAAGTVVTPGKMDSADPASVADIRSAPTGITDTGKAYTWITQINTATSGFDAASHKMLADGTSPTKPFVLRPGEGLYLRQIANNTSTFRCGFLHTEE